MQELIRTMRLRNQALRQNKALIKIKHVCILAFMILTLAASVEEPVELKLAPEEGLQGSKFTSDNVVPDDTLCDISYKGRRHSSH